LDFPKIAILVILTLTVAGFVWGRFRHDVVALGALMATLATGLVTPADAFTGFSHPAVITVACVLILSGALQSTGAIDVVSRKLIPASAGPTLTILAISSLAALLSAFMNNVGALALLMPIGIQVAARLDIAAGRVLMPLAFGSILGGMTTLIGTPPNLIVSGFRAQQGEGGRGFAMFDFTPVGLAVCLSGLALIAIAWRLTPARKRSDVGSFETGAYLTEARVAADSPLVGDTVRAAEKALEDADGLVLGLVRGASKVAAPGPYQELHAGDILLVEGKPGVLGALLASAGLELAEAVDVSESVSATQTAEAASAAETEAAETRARALASGDVTLMELSVRPYARITNLSATDVDLRRRYGINLIAVSREGAHTIERLNRLRIRGSDVLLVQGTPDSIAEFAQTYELVPLAARALTLPDARKALMAGVIMTLAIGAGAFGVMPTAIAFAAGVLAVVVFGIVPTRRLYDAIDWSVIVLLGALMPVAAAVSSTGAADLIARLIIDNLASGDAVIALAAILIVTMTLSDVMNNAATAAVMCPIALGVAQRLDSNPDAFLMSVAIGASCAFLTPIGHQNNTLIMGPGGFRFGDYWRLGLPLEILVIAVSIPTLIFFWPL
jgi:di/tricarboxylate transporter